MKKIFLLLSLFLIVLTSQAQLQDVNARYISGSTLKSISRHTLSGHMIFVNPSNGRMYSTDSIPAWITISPSILNSWSLTGNAGTDTATNFIGTTDAVNLLFKVGGSRWGLFNENLQSIFLGYRGGITATGSYNAGYGYSTLSGLTTGSYNTSVGYYSLYKLKTASNCIGLGSWAGANFGNSHSPTNADNLLFINSIFRGGEYGDSTLSIIYGRQNALLANQHLWLNATTHINQAYSLPTTVGAAGQIITSDGAGSSSWATITAKSYWDSTSNAIHPTDTTNAVAIGTNSAPSGTMLRVNDGAVLFEGSTGTTPVSGAGTRMMWIPSKAAFRAGYVDGTRWDDSLVGLYSTAMGYNTAASGEASTAMGSETTASGDYSTAMGYYTAASGVASTAMGYNTIASGQTSIAMGQSTTASGEASTAMGVSTAASSDVSTAMGLETTASGLASTAMGMQTTASGDKSTAIGDQTTASEENSTAMGYRTTASGWASTAIGNSSRAIGASSFAGGMGKAYGAYSFAFGDSCRTSTAGSYGVAMGYGNKVTSIYGVAMGYNTTASGGYSTAMGTSTTATGDNSTTMGVNTIASGEASTAMGASTTASGYISTAMGMNTTAIGDYSTAMGYNTTASGWASFASGELNTVSGDNSFVSGMDNLASGNVSFAVGSNNVSSGGFTSTLGYYNFAKSISQTTLGMYCDTTGMKTWDDISWVGTDPLLSVGNGGYSGGNTRNNALTILKNGTTYIGDASSTTDPILTVSTTDSTTTLIGELTTSDSIRGSYMAAAGTGITLVEVTATGALDSIAALNLAIDTLPHLYTRMISADTIYSSSGSIQINYKFTLADDASLNLPTGSGFGQVKIDSVGVKKAAIYNFTFDNNGAPDIISNTANVVNTDTDTKFCLYDNGAYATLKNRLGYSVTCLMSITYYKP